MTQETSSLPKLRSDEKQIESYRYNYKKGKLGRGTFGTVYKGIDLVKKQNVAIKLIKKKHITNKDEEQQLLNEIHILRSLKNPNIIEIIDVLQTENNFYLILEYCNMGDLETQLITHKNLRPHDHYHFLIDILSAFTSLVKQGIIHRDLKPANILINEENGKRQYKLADFGLAKSVDNFKHQLLEKKVGTPYYMSPQILNDQPYTCKTDIWSLGLILYQFVYQRTPWAGRSEPELLHNILHHHLHFPDSIHSLNPQCKDFILNCLQVKEENRFSWETLFQHPYVKDHFIKFQLEQRNFENKLTYVIGYLREKVRNAQALELLFSKLDTSGDKLLEFNEFQELIHSIDHGFDQQDIKYIFNEFDADGNGTIDYAEFKKILYPKPPKQCDLFRSLSRKNYEIIKELHKIIHRYQMSPRALFRKFDTSQNDALDKEELMKLLQKVDLKKQLTAQDIDEIIHAFDENGDGEIQYDEFKKVIESVDQGRRSQIVIDTEAQVQNLPHLECRIGLQQLQNSSRNAEFELCNNCNI